VAKSLQLATHGRQLSLKILKIVTGHFSRATTPLSTTGD